eukprot:TRINITY_DN3571_c0_g1_i1.p1 TRINITY_DN3571_c0_g1~~TRINITY_DN3571_c0_g1_i1.p1  ORF type:complete len:338 (-),score=55.31 TRINITY_DN3571_c0_g1_i1:197-1111(-)
MGNYVYLEMYGLYDSSSRRTPTSPRGYDGTSDRGRSRDTPERSYYGEDDDHSNRPKYHSRVRPLTAYEQHAAAPKRKIQLGNPISMFQTSTKALSVMHHNLSGPAKNLVKQSNQVFNHLMKHGHFPSSDDYIKMALNEDPRHLADIGVRELRDRIESETPKRPVSPIRDYYVPPPEDRGQFYRTYSKPREKAYQNDEINRYYKSNLQQVNHELKAFVDTKERYITRIESIKENEFRTNRQIGNDLREVEGTLGILKEQIKNYRESTNQHGGGFSFSKPGDFHHDRGFQNTEQLNGILRSTIFPH